MLSVRIALLGVLLTGSALFAAQPGQPKVSPIPTQKQIARWIVQLGSDDFLVREAATEQLAKAGVHAEADLKKAAINEDAEVARRAGDLLERIEEIKEAANPPLFRRINSAKAIAMARSEKKVVMVYFYADWCGPCKMLDRETFSDKQVTKLLKEKTIAIRINTDDNAKMAKEHKIKALPCLVFVNGEGEEVGRLLGYEPADPFIEEATKILDK